MVFVFLFNTVFFPTAAFLLRELDAQNVDSLQYLILNISSFSAVSRYQFGSIAVLVIYSSNNHHIFPQTYYKENSNWEIDFAM